MAVCVAVIVINDNAEDQRLTATVAAATTMTEVQENNLKKLTLTTAIVLKTIITERQRQL